MAHIGVRTVCAGIAALATGVALVSVCRHVGGPAGAILRAESAVFSGFETVRSKNLDDRGSLVRVASLETGFAFESAVQEEGPPASRNRDASFNERFLFDRKLASFGERFLFDRKLASFDERFAGADISVAEVEGGTADVLNYASLPVQDPGPTADRPIRAEACTSRFITARERRKKARCDCGGIEGSDFTGRA